jgi:hypothetical protein
MMHSVKVTRKNSSNTNDLISYPQSMIYPQHFQPQHLQHQHLQQMYYPPSLSYYYPDYDSDFQRRSSISQTSDHSLSVISQISDNLTKKMVISMEDFLKNLDQEFGDGKFTCYLSVFEEQEILVNQLPKLSDSEYISMGVTIIGRRQRLRDEAKKYE